MPLADPSQTRTDRTAGALTVGVVIPVYRSEPYIRACLESVLAQTHPVTQIVVVDDRGDDRAVPIAAEILAGSQVRHRVVTQPVNGGLGRARNAGLAAVETDLVWFLDSDVPVPEHARPW